MRRRTTRASLGAWLAVAGWVAGSAWAQQADGDLAAGLQSMVTKSYAEAAKQFQAAVQADPTAAPAHFFLGQALYRQAGEATNTAEKAQLLDQAAAALSKALELAPSTPQTRLYLGRVRVEQGRYAEGLAELNAEMELSRPQRREEIYNGIGMAYAGMGRLVDAESAFRKCIDLDRNYCEARYNLAGVYLRMREAEKAIDELDKLNKTMREYRSYLSRLNKQIERGTRKPTLTQEWVDQTYRYAEEFSTRQPQAFKLAGRVYHSVREYGNARNAYRQALKEANDGNESDVDARTSVAAESLADAEDRVLRRNLVLDPWKILTVADEDLEEILKLNSEFAPAHNARGECYLLQAQLFLPNEDRGIKPKTLADARQSLDRAVEVYAKYANDPAALAPLRSPENWARAEYNLGRVDRAENKLQSAVTHFEKARQLRPNYPEATALLAEVQAKLGNADIARTLMDEALQAEPDAEVLYNVQGQLLMALNRPTEAARAFRSAIDREPGMAEAHINLGMALYQTESWSAARQSFDQALTILPRSQVLTLASRRAELYWLIGRTYASDGMAQEAIKAYNEALALNPSYLAAERDLGRAYQTVGNLDAAESAFRSALTLAEASDNATRANLHLDMGWLYAKMGRYHNAYVEATRAKALVPDLKGADDLANHARAQMAGTTQAAAPIPPSTPATEMPGPAAPAPEPAPTTPPADQ